MNEYCENHKAKEICTLTNRLVTAGYCKIVCKQRPDQYKKEGLDKFRANLRKPLTNKEKSDKDTVTVIMPVGKIDEQYIDRTVQSIKDNAVGSLEILIENDKEHEGHRVLTNRMAGQAKGKYLLRIDAHSSMSEGWDARMKLSCGPTTLLTPIIDALDPEIWIGRGRDMSMVTLTRTMQNTYPMFDRSIPDRNVEEETMSILGCTYMIQKEYYWHHQGCEESLGIWGAGGLEWVLKVWLTGGKVMVRTDTVCCHLFRDDGKIPFDIDIERLNKTFVELGNRWRSGLGRGQTRSLVWLEQKFSKYLNHKVQWAGRDNRDVFPLDARKKLQAVPQKDSGSG